MSEFARSRPIVLSFLVVLGLRADPGFAQDVGGVVDVAESFRRLDTQAARAEIVRRLLERPDEVFRRLDVLAAEGLGEGAPRREVIEQGLVAALATACEQSVNPAPFMRRGGPDELPAYTLGVTQGLVRRLASGWKPGSRDEQGTPAVDRHLARIVSDREQPTTLRALACEGLAACPDLAREPAEVLIFALAEKDIQLTAAARRALDVHAKRPGATVAQLESWAAGLPGPPAPPRFWTAQALLALADGDPRARTERLRAFEDQLSARGSQVLLELDTALEELDRDQALTPDVRGAVVTSVAGAVARVTDPVGFAGSEVGHPALAAALARGIGLRCGAFELRRIVAARRAAEAGAGESQPPAPPEIPHAEDLLAVLAALLDRPEVEVRSEVYRAVPALLESLDAAWFDRLSRALEDPATQRDAWASLKLISGQELPLSVKAWREWFGRPSGARAPE